jgi:hypothetical protein
VEWSGRSKDRPFLLACDVIDRRPLNRGEHGIRDDGGPGDDRQFTAGSDWGAREKRRVIAGD